MSSTDFALSVSTRIAQRVKRLPKGQPFCISRFAELGARGAISADFTVIWPPIP